MKKKYTKAKVEIISMKTEAFICTSPENNTGTGTNPEPGGGDGDLPGPPPPGAKAFEGNGVTDFSFDPTPSAEE